MEYKKLFDVKEFPWCPAAVHVIMKAKNTGKIDELGEEIEYEFTSYSHVTSESEINQWVVDNANELLRKIGLAPNGRPLPVKKPIKVFLRLTAIVEQEVDVDTPEEAREVAEERFLEESDPMIDVVRDDIESLVPVAYDMGDGNTKDYDTQEGGEEC